MKNDLMIRNPEIYFDGLHNELNNFLRDTLLSPMFSNPLNMKKITVWRPAIEVKQTDKEYKVRVELPGVNKENIDVRFDNDLMTITAEIEEEKEEQEEKENNEKYHTCEFHYGKYKRTLSFDNPIKYKEVKAKYENGILKITVPKQNPEEFKKEHKIEIE